MAENTGIEWCDSTFNPWIGCTRVSPACDDCYAARSTPVRTMKIVWGPGEPRKRTSATNWKEPVTWNRHALSFELEHGRRRRVFCASLADVFDNEVPPEWRYDLFELIRATPKLDWLLLTKRIGNAFTMLPADFCAERYPNVWIGITVVNQAEVDRDLPKLNALNVATRWLSIEPLLEAVDLGWERLWGTGGSNGIDWVVAGGESGPKARPMHPDWVRKIRDDCKEAGVPFLFKQWGEHDLSYDRDRDDPDYKRCAEVARQPGRWINLAGGHGFHGDRVHYAHKVGKKASGRTLDGQLHDGFPT